MVAALAWAAYTVLTPSAPPPGDTSAGARLGELPEASPGDTTSDVGSVAPSEPDSREPRRVDQPPQSDSANLEPGEAPATISEGGTSPEDAALRAWRTADGKLYFGIAPPPGSVKIESFGKPAAPKSTPPPLARPTEPGVSPLPTPAQSDSRLTSSAWSQPQACSLETTIEHRAMQEDRVGGGMILSGVLTHTGSTLIKDVSVCSEETCTLLLEGRPMRGGDHASFSLRLAAGAGPVVRCSILKPQ